MFHHVPHRFQSTLPRGGATAVGIEGRPAIIVSIHAPPRGSDLRGTIGMGELSVSIHAPPRGSDAPQCTLDSNKISFNPRSPAGERRDNSLKLGGDRFQSTLPRGGATRQTLKLVEQRVFQSTLPRGGATETRCGVGSKHLFQSTLPRGGATL